MGGEREPVMLSNLTAMIIGVIGAVSMAWITVIIAILFYFAAISLLRRMARKDPIMTRVWRRHIAYRHYYSARSSYWAIRCYLGSTNGK